MQRAHNDPPGFTGKPVKLHKDLVPFQHDGAIRHPLVHRRDTHPVLRCDINNQYKRNLERLRIAKQDKNWFEFVFTHERPYRLRTLFSLAENVPQKAKGAYGKIVADFEPTLTNSAYWKLVAAVWTDLENIWQYAHELDRIFYPKRFDHNKRRQMMKSKERKAYDALPNVVTVYRGCGPENQMGWSWTIDKKKGVWFAERFDGAGHGGVLLSARCSKVKILALFLARGESEVVIDPTRIKARQIKVATG